MIRLLRIVYIRHLSVTIRLPATATTKTCDAVTWEKLHAIRCAAVAKAAAADQVGVTTSHSHREPRICVPMDMC